MNDVKSDREPNIDRLIGEVAALGLAVRALFITHPDRKSAAACFHAEYERAVSEALPRPLPDEFLAGMQSVRDRVLLKPKSA